MSLPYKIKGSHGYQCDSPEFKVIRQSKHSNKEGFNMTEYDWINEIINSTDSIVKPLPVLETINNNQINQDISDRESLNNLKQPKLLTELTPLQKAIKGVDIRASNDFLSESFPQKETQGTERTRQASFKESYNSFSYQLITMSEAFG